MSEEKRDTSAAVAAPVEEVAVAEGIEAAAATAKGAAAEGIEAAAPATSKKKEPAGMTRRSLFIGVGSTAVLLGLGGLRYAGHKPLVRPPGGQDEAHLVSACIRCEKCYEACPHHVIVPAHIEDGLLGMRSPQLNFSSSYCDFCAEANDGVPLCVTACPTEALSLPAGATAKDTYLGIAVIDEKQCLAFRDTGCRYCYDACNEAGFEAITLDDEGRNPLPRVVDDKCVGCGACESVCVSLKAGAIVAGSTERAIVVKPQEMRKVGEA